MVKVTLFDGVTRRGTWRLASAAVAVCVLSAVPPVATTIPGAGAAARPRATTSRTVWLCRPGRAAGDPCAYNPAVTTVTAAGTASTSTPVSTPASHAFDCFYVYPTVSSEPGTNADLAIQPAEIGVAVAQASPFSQACRVWAPMYRQATRSAIASGAILRPSVVGTAYGSLLSAWRDYLVHDNHGRPIVFIGHSQGAAMLIKLLRTQVDPSPALRKRLVSAIILGGNVQVPVGGTVGGTFRHIPTCRSASQTGCVIAYSSFGTPPPSASFFGRPGQGVSLQSGQTAKSGQLVACVNPVNFSAQPGGLQPLFLSATSRVGHLGVTTPWVSYPGLYTAQCEQGGGASWLQVTATPGPADPRPTVSATLGPLWGYHQADVNLALGNLVADVGVEEAAFH